MIKCMEQIPYEERLKRQEFPFQKGVVIVGKKNYTMENDKEKQTESYYSLSALYGEKSMEPKGVHVKLDMTDSSISVSLSTELP